MGGVLNLRRDVMSVVHLIYWRKEKLILVLCYWLKSLSFPTLIITWKIT